MGEPRSTRPSPILGLHLVPDPVAPGLARAAISTALPAGMSAEKRSDLVLLVSEIVTNAVRHGPHQADRELDVRVETSPGSVRVRVTNPGAPSLAPATERVSDWTQYLLGRLASVWGVEERGTGTVVWFDLDLDLATPRDEG